MAYAILVIAQRVMHEQDLITSELHVEVRGLYIKLLQLHIKPVSKHEDGTH
jgi:hypothetical protein